MKEIDSALYEFMRSDKCQDMIEYKDLSFNTPVTLTYALERLAIVHIRLWVLEDQVRDKTLLDAQIGNLKRRIDYLNGTVRPRLIAGIGEIFAKAVKDGNEELVREPDFKDYRARE
jgi:hypothetical protein